ncbi:type I restriction endonuclease subunit R [Flavobacterium capsici]|uniref:Type I restriction enzyme endonuclease subunit n=1 Tax=Flavobacterium capsici TaxID=3075618 RepID=A0AA96ETI4_9FLAO|nr:MULTISPECIES: type I restriction endonuclease subunit R [unclassified Flavobacterium]WNM17976.1 type I restriction endonuclease subunit R [Flavobacterium sp. PMR2A8]WNM22028.1 type I restriction endonuclease subunit R [Flavobacterium sp. PMTSA4]
MTSQSELILEQNLINQLAANGYDFVTIKDEGDLLVNLKKQLEKHNNKTFSDSDFKQILNHLSKSNNIFEKALLLRDKFAFKNDNNELVYVEFINMDFWCQNEYQVTNQITVEGSYKNRYDVTILINGLPLVQIELKKTGIELKEAYNQINRYQKHSFSSNTGLFNFIQLFVISNGVNTKYFSNFGNKKPDFKQTFYWTDDNNKRISKLEDFANTFLEKCHLSKMITKYIVLHDTTKQLMVLRPYQFFAVERIIEKVKNTNKNGYIWHTTGSGKTLTSFKASQILSQLPKVDKVVFCVDRQDLDYQTAKEFNAFKPDCIDPTNNTKNLVAQFNDNNNKLIVTTIQKLYNAVTRDHHLKTMDNLKDKKIVFIFDECHRSQFGDTHKRITQYFTNYQLFGFTGTPIFAENAQSKTKENQTTASLFGEKLHQYVITDAIKDENVLRFSVEYVGKYKEKENSQNEVDIEVEAIDTKELLESQERLEKISNYIIQQHSIKTQNKTFTAMFCVSSVEVLIKYYDLLQKLKDEGKHDLKVATIFSYGANDDMITDVENYDSADFNEVAEDEEVYTAVHKRDKLESYIQHYNQMFGMNYSTKDTQIFYNYYKDIAKRVRAKEVDLLLVVNMFLTGFDSPSLNTLFVDKNLRYHGLIQAYSRTNRILGEKKSQGNIIVFRNLKKATDDAIALFSNKDAKEIIIMQPYDKYVKDIDEAYEKLISITPTFESVDDLYSEEEELEFVKAFRELIRLKNIISSFVDFSFEDIKLDEQEFENYKSKYLDLSDKSTKEKTSILNEVDFELELIHRDDITVTYILGLLAKLKATTAEEKERKQKEILDLVAGEAKLRSKRELIEQFIIENLPLIDTENIEEEYTQFMKEQQDKAFLKFAEEEKLNKEKLQKLTEDYLFNQRTPTKQEVIAVMEEQPSILQRATVGETILRKFMNFISTFFND